ncbi:MAG: hypothetical protein LAQ30_28190 [Acidobacteriia bacterium]|nr:hypothetical protein [Terriglobia bacterium]
MTTLFLKRLCPTALLLTLAFAPLACKKEKIRVQQTEEEAPRLASTVHMGDARVQPQLVNGFYGIEDNAWRWTARQFTVVLRPPFGAAQKGGVLKVQLTVPDPVIQKLKTTTLSASINGHALPPETYTQQGEYTFTRDVPANLLTGESAKVDFQLDKAIPPSGNDMRELGIVVLSIGLEPK